MSGETSSSCLWELQAHDGMVMVSINSDIFDVGTCWTERLFPTFVELQLQGPYSSLQIQQAFLSGKLCLDSRARMVGKMDRESVPVCI